MPLSNNVNVRDDNLKSSLLKHVLPMVMHVSIAKAFMSLRTESVKMVYGVFFVVIARSHLFRVPVLSR